MTEKEFEQMIREHRSTIYTVCYMFSSDRDEVADLFQETLINLWLENLSYEEIGQIVGISPKNVSVKLVRIMIFTIILFLVAIVATVLAKGHLPRLDRDLLSATEELTRFRKISADWIKYGLPALIVWLGMFIWQILSCTDIGESEMYGLFGGIAVGLVIGLTLGLKNRRDILNGTDELLDQIEELKKEA